MMRPLCMAALIGAAAVACSTPSPVAVDVALLCSEVPQHMLDFESRAEAFAAACTEAEAHIEGGDTSLQPLLDVVHSLRDEDAVLRDADGRVVSRSRISGFVRVDATGRVTHERYSPRDLDKDIRVGDRVVAVDGVPFADAAGNVTNRYSRNAAINPQPGSSLVLRVREPEGFEQDIEVNANRANAGSTLTRYGHVMIVSKRPTELMLNTTIGDLRSRLYKIAPGERGATILNIDLKHALALRTMIFRQVILDDLGAPLGPTCAPPLSKTIATPAQPIWRLGVPMIVEVSPWTSREDLWLAGMMRHEGSAVVVGNTGPVRHVPTHTITSTRSGFTLSVPTEPECPSDGFKRIWTPMAAAVYDSSVVSLAKERAKTSPHGLGWDTASTDARG